jgi:hypothetical protein
MMIVSLPTMVAQSSLDKGSLDLIRDYTNELIQYVFLNLSLWGRTGALADAVLFAAA